ncbi:hypothetical protein HanIR_Chr09g0439961 [Helianthus annuus]|nr:hypothetical protein HanIR_Chr09g0439961 [Helianthus annuus]
MGKTLSPSRSGWVRLGFLSRYFFCLANQQSIALLFATSVRVLLLNPFFSLNLTRISSWHFLISADIIVILRYHFDF